MHIPRRVSSHQVLVRGSARPHRLQSTDVFAAGVQAPALVHPGLVRVRKGHIRRRPSSGRGRDRLRVRSVDHAAARKSLPNALLRSLSRRRVSSVVRRVLSLVNSSSTNLDASVYRFMSRTMLISIVSRKALRLSGESRAKHSNGQLITHISADASFFDWAALLFLYVFFAGHVTAARAGLISPVFYPASRLQ